MLVYNNDTVAGAPQDPDADSVHQPDDLVEALEDFLPLSTTEMLDNVLALAVDTTKSLLRLSKTIRNPAARDLAMVASTMDTTTYEDRDVSLIRRLYRHKGTAEHLMERLGHANIVRRRMLQYNKEHRGLTASPLSEDDGGDNGTSTTSLPEGAEEVDTAWDTTWKDDDDIGPDDTVRTTTGATEHVNIVPFPEGAKYGQNFECPLCYCIVLMRNHEDWK